MVAIAEFPVGVHPLELRVRDGLAEDTDGFDVEVVTIPGAISDVLDAVEDVVAGRGKRPAATLRAALASMDRGNPVSALNQEQSFENEVRAQVAPADPDLGSLLLPQAQGIIDALEAGQMDRPGRAPLKAVMRNGGLQVAFDAAPAKIRVIGASTNLLDWEGIGVVHSDENGQGRIGDLGREWLPWRYHRIVRP